MNSPTHTLIALAILARKDDRKRNWAVFAGSVIPDLFIYIGAFWYLVIMGETGERMWREIYFDAPMQKLSAIFNSVPLFMSIALLGFLFRLKLWGKILFCVGLAALTHIALDFPVHVDDAHSHFWPITEWKFRSSFSYWNNNHHAHWVSLFEASIGILTATILWKRFPKTWAHLCLATLILLYLVMTLFWWWPR